MGMPPGSILATLIYWSYTVIDSTFSRSTHRLLTEFEYRIREEIPIGSEVGNLIDDILAKTGEFDIPASHATTSSGQTNTPHGVKFTIINAGEAGANSFQIRPDGRIITVRRIDRETLCTRSTFGSNARFSGIFNQFSQITPPLLHPNIAAFGTITSDNMFCPVMLRIMTSVNDRDSALNTNSQDVESVLNIRILIQDINDNAPTWPGHLKRFQVTFRDGDSIGERRTLPLAADSDVGTNAQLRYELVPPKDVDRGFSPFGLVEHPVDGLYIQALKNVDREERETYQFVLQAIDRANGAVDQQGGGSERQLTSRLIIDVLIVDINDNAPLFTQPVFTPNGPVAETTPVGRTVLVLNATDADTGINGAFHFAFSREHAWITSEVFARQYFDVRPNGQVVVRRPLNVDQMHTTTDPALLTRANAVRLPNEEGLVTMNHIMPSVGQPRGPTMQFRFRVMVEDEAMRPYTRSSEATVIITVTDENDEAPIIDIRVGKDQNFTPLTTSAVEHFRFRHLTVSENQPVGTVIATIQAFDPDFGGTDHVDCYLKTPNFTLTQSNPVTRTAVDSGNGLMTYLLKTAAELDRESTHSQLVALYCADLDGHMTEQNLTIHISDTNDNSPQFQRHEYVMQVEENMPPGTHLRHAGRFQDYTNRTQHSVLATDRDAGQNAELYYILSESGRNSSYFLIDSQSGALSTAVMLNREENAQFVLQVTAVDRGNPPRTGTTTVKVNIIDKNDNVPQFTQHAYTFHVMENRPGTESVGQVSATDQDSEAHGSIHYYLSNDPDAFVFRIELMTGILRTRQPLDREKQAKFQFLVFARDGNVPEVSSGPGSMGPMQLTGTATVTVVVDDENDNWPIFISPNATANTLAIAVDETLGHKLAYIQATDADEGENALISYQIRSGNTNSLFGLDKSTGLLYLASAPNPIVEANHLELERNNSVVMSLSEGGVKPDAIKPSVHTLTLEACDNGQQPRPKCTLFKNLRVFIKTLRDGELDNSERVRNVAQAQSDGENGRTSFSGNQLPSMSTHYNEVGVVDNAMMYGQTVAGARYTVNEIIIVCLSALFIIVLLITLLLVCLIRRRSIGNSSQNKAMDGARRTHHSTCHLHPLLTSLNCASLSTKVQLGSGRLSESRSPHRNSSQTANDANGAMDSICPFRECTPAENELFSVNTFSDSRYTLLPRDTDAGAQRQLSMAIGEPTNLPAFEQSLEQAEEQNLSQKCESVTSNPSDEYQTLDYLGLLTSTVPNRFQNFSDGSGQLTMSPVALNSSEAGTESNANEEASHRLDAIHLMHRNRFPDAEMRHRSPNARVNSYSLVYSTPAHVRTHSISQPHVINARYMAYSAQAPLQGGDGSCLLPAARRGMIYSATRMMTKSAQNVFGKQYATLNSRHPSLSHTYYDIRQPDRVIGGQLTLPKSKSQLITSGNPSAVVPTSADVQLSNLAININYAKKLNKEKIMQLLPCMQPSTCQSEATTDSRITAQWKWSANAEHLNCTTKPNSPPAPTASRLLTAAYHESSFV